MYKGKLVACQHGSRRLVTMDAETFETLEVIADKTPEGRGFNSPNDVSIEGTTAYFTDPTYGWILTRMGPADLPYVEKACERKGAGVKGVYKVDLETKNIELFTDRLDRPNGIAYFRDLIWVANSAENNCSWSAFNLDGDLVKHIPYSSLNPEDLGPGLIDGFEFDPVTGYLWSTAPGGVVVLDVVGETPPKILASVKMNTNTANLAFDTLGENPSHVYVTGLSHLWRLTRNLLLLPDEEEQKEEL